MKILLMFIICLSLFGMNAHAVDAQVLFTKIPGSEKPGDDRVLANGYYWISLNSEEKKQYLIALVDGLRSAEQMIGSTINPANKERKEIDLKMAASYIYIVEQMVSDKSLSEIIDYIDKIYADKNNLIIPINGVYMQLSRFVEDSLKNGKVTEAALTDALVESRKGYSLDESGQ